MTFHIQTAVKNLRTRCHFDFQTAVDAMSKYKTVRICLFTLNLVGFLHVSTYLLIKLLVLVCDFRPALGGGLLS